MKFGRIVNLVCLVGFISIAAADRNNVCKKWISYAFRDISKNCYYDIDAKSDVVSEYNVVFVVKRDEHKRFLAFNNNTTWI